MTCHTRLYIALAVELVNRLRAPELQIRSAIRSGLRSYGVRLTSFEFDDTVVLIGAISEDRDSETVKDIVFESLTNRVAHTREIDIEIDSEVSVEFDI